MSHNDYAKIVVMAKTKKKLVSTKEPDGVYFLKLVLYLIIGSQWLRITRGNLQFPIPVGLIIGLLFTRAERFQIDRKIEYAILLIATFVGFWLPIGFEILL